MERNKKSSTGTKIVPVEKKSSVYKKPVVILFLVILQLAMPLTVLADNTTLTFGWNRRGWLVRTQDAYLPNQTITHLGLNNPQSIVFGPGDLLYIADTGNRRIVVYDVNTGETVRIVTYSGFQSPRGVFVTEENLLYVADALAGAVFIFDENGEPLRSHFEPTALSFGETRFAPNRIAVDRLGSMFIVGEGVFDGIIQLSGEGEFLGFFASNQTTRTFVQMLQDTFFTERQLAGLAPRLPHTFSNLTIDGRGVVYSSSMGTLTALEDGALRRHDMAGRNTIAYTIPISDIADITVDRYGNIIAASASGFIWIFTNEGSLIFYFGAGHAVTEDIAGWFRSLVSIAVSSEGNIWALDGQSAFLQSFTPTEYAQTVYTALNLFNAGLYQESAYVWETVLRHNQMSVLAHNGLGRARLYQQDFDGARESFYLAGNRFYYSAAFWEVRNIWLLNNVAIVLIVIAAMFLITTIIKYADRKKVIAGKIATTKAKVMDAPGLKPILFAFTVARHPMDSYYYMKLKQKGSVGGAVFHFFLFFAAYMIYTMARGFIVQFADVADIDFVVVIGGFFGLFVLFILSNYLVTSIKDGEGGIVDIFKLVSYGLFPLTITLLGVTLLSHIVTLNEVFLLDFALLFGGIYTISVLWLGFQETHNYSFRSTLTSLLITFGFMAIMLVVIFNLTVLFDGIVTFIESIGQEAYINVRGLY